MQIFSSAILIFLLLLMTQIGTAQKIDVKVNSQNCAADAMIFVMEFDGFEFAPVRKQPVAADGTATFTLPETRPRVYYVGTASNNMIPVILGSEKGVELTAPCSKFRSAKVSNSPLNEGYTSLKSQIKTFKNSNRSMQRQLLKADGNKEQEQKAMLGMANIDKQKLELMDSLQRTEPFLGAVAELNTYLSYQLYGEGFPDELNYFVNMYFNYANWEAADYQYNPWVYESVKAYAQTLSGIGIPDEQHALALNTVLAKIPQDSRTYKLAYGGLLAGLEGKKHDNYAVFAQAYIDAWKDKDKKNVAVLENKMKTVSQLMVGGTAPDFTQDTPEGTPLALSDLRGKVVLVDFWASWCGPCRRENPNVVNVYQKYKDRGFEVLSVSLDSNRDKWLAAIARDNMDWSHVSDLQGWKNAAAQTYGISSIPATLLLDKDGKIIARNLRGPALEARLKKVFD